MHFGKQQVWNIHGPSRPLYLSVHLFIYVNNKYINILHSRDYICVFAKGVWDMLNINQHRILNDIMSSFLVFFIYSLGISVSLSSSSVQRENGICPLWHIRNKNGKCEFGASLNGVISCDKDYIYVENGYCLTWNNLTNMQ